MSGNDRTSNCKGLGLKFSTLMMNRNTFARYDKLIAKLSRCSPRLLEVVVLDP